MKRCMYCGNENDDSSQNCSKCGNRLLDIPTDSAEPAVDMPEEAFPAQEVPPVQEDAFPAAENGTEEEMPGFLAEQGIAPETDAQQYAARPEVANDIPYQGGYPYGYPQGYEGQPEVQQQYGGQAYGYQQQVQQYGHPAQNQPQNGYDYGRAQQVSGGSRQILVKARKMVKSPLFFLVVLFHTVMTVASILNVVTGNLMLNLNELQAQIQAVMKSNLAVSFMNGAIDLVEGTNSMIITGIGLALCLPGILVCIGLWIMFLQTKRNPNEPISTSGYTLTWVMELLKFIAVCLLLAVGLILSVAFVVAAGAASSTASIIVGIILLVIMILISVMTILFYVQLLHGMRVIKFNAKVGADRGRISTYVPFIGILMCALTVLSMLPMAPNDYLGLAGQGATAAWLLFTSIWIFVYRAKVRR